MKLIFFFILLFVGANCSGLSEVVKKEIKESYLFCQLNNKLLKELQTSVDQLIEGQMEISSTVDQLTASVAEIKKENNETSSFLKTLEHNQKIVSNSEDLQKSSLNINKLQDSVDRLNASMARNITDLLNQSSSNSRIFDHKLDEILKKLEKEQLVDQKFSSISEEHNETLSLKALENKLYDIQETEKILDKKIVANSEDLQKFKDELDVIIKGLSDDCSDLYNVGLNVSTSYFLQKYNRKVNCDMETEGGGWLVIQQRKEMTSQVDFNRNWASYKEGFGDLDTEFWIGNKFLHRITNQKLYELRIDMEDFEKGPFYATYSEFRVGNEESGYKLHVGGYEGIVKDSLSYQNHEKFTTFDRDNDYNCAERHSGGSWYSSNCYHANLNGMYPTVPDRKNEKLINWVHNGERLQLINVEMKIRPKQ